MALLPPDPVICLRSPEQSSYHSLCFRTPEHLYAGTLKGTVQLWDLQTNRVSYQLTVGSSSILNLAHTEDALITQEKCGTVKLWNLTDAGYVLQHELSNDHAGYCRMACDVQANAVIMPRDKSTVSVLCSKTMTETIRFSPTADEEQPVPFGSVMCVLPVTLDGQRYLMAGYESGLIAMWDYRTGRVIGTPTLFASDGDCLFTVDYDPVTNRGICGGSSNNLSVFSVDRKALQLVPKSKIPIKNAGVHRVRIRKDLKVFSSAGWDGRLRIFSWKSLRPLAVLTEHKGELLDIAYSEGRVTMWKAPVMAAAGSDGQISLWDLYK
ncbi:guanine nucleotide-binding protein subunit beta-like protein 1 [Anopheles ziemanni]|uniref:guanine nucleotide-binding protein subunit beta-like protein 1 n=1 Tax=Anopheles coustani TaxID=139045 RepID=UPI00265B27F1|nr:guanine nucleotide-binding protein subunit beta-like protein 1 [Anopheles coustani]XP_058172669.1 guanine nucleotide-binding protein subunit beta-like protein 1 [Anopheles ziemanni]